MMEAYDVAAVFSLPLSFFCKCWKLVDTGCVYHSLHLCILRWRGVHSDVQMFPWNSWRYHLTTKAKKHSKKHSGFSLLHLPPVWWEALKRFCMFLLRRKNMWVFANCSNIVLLSKRQKGRSRTSCRSRATATYRRSTRWRRHWGRFEWCIYRVKWPAGVPHSHSLYFFASHSAGDVFRAVRGVAQRRPVSSTGPCTSTCAGAM